MDERTLWLEGAVVRWEKRLRRVCFAYLGDEALAEDAVQETFIKAWKGYGRFRREADEQTWLMRIAVNTCKDVRRSAWFRHIDRRASLDALPEGAVPFTDRENAVTQAVFALPPKLRAAVILHIGQGLTAEQAAQALNISRSALFYRIKQARAILKRELEGWQDET